MHCDLRERERSLLKSREFSWHIKFTDLLLCVRKGIQD